MISRRLPVPREAPRVKKSSRGISMEEPAVDNPKKNDDREDKNCAELLSIVPIINY